MQFILKLLRKILESLKDYYTSSQFDELVGVKVGKDSFNVDLSAESEARASADEALESEISSAVSNQTALENVARWQGYANAMQSMVDEETAAQIAEEFEKATVEYLKDPTKTKDWSRPSIDENNNPYAESTPSVLVDFSKINATGFQEKYSKYPSFGGGDVVVALFPNAKSLKNAFNLHAVIDIFLMVGEQTDITYALGRVSANTGEHANDEHRVYFYGKTTCENLLMLPPKYCSFVSTYVTSIDTLFGGTGVYYTIGGTDALRLTLNTPNVVSARFALARYSSYSGGVSLIGGLPKCTDITGFVGAANTSGEFHKVLKSIEFVGVEPSFPLAEVAVEAFKNRAGFDQSITFPSLHTGGGMFLNAGMSMENISSVLNSLPPDPVGEGGTGVITFTGCPGASELTQDSPSVANAVARGWTVEL